MQATKIKKQQVKIKKDNTHEKKTYDVRYIYIYQNFGTPIYTKYLL